MLNYSFDIILPCIKCIYNNFAKNNDSKDFMCNNHVNVKFIKNFKFVFLKCLLYQISMILMVNFFRRDKLWICMEYCGGGSMQDIYHSKT